jgi:hypothetical protein
VLRPEVGRCPALAPRARTDAEIPDFDKFSRSPGPMLILRRKRKPTFQCTVWAARTSANSAMGHQYFYFFDIFAADAIVLNE